MHVEVHLTEALPQFVSDRKAIQHYVMQCGGCLYIDIKYSDAVHVKSRRWLMRREYAIGHLMHFSNVERGRSSTSVCRFERLWGAYYTQAHPEDLNQRFIWTQYTVSDTHIRFSKHIISGPRSSGTSQANNISYTRTKTVGHLRMTGDALRRAA